MGCIFYESQKTRNFKIFFAASHFFFAANATEKKSPRKHSLTGTGEFPLQANSQRMGSRLEAVHQTNLRTDRLRATVANATVSRKVNCEFALNVGHA